MDNPPPPSKAFCAMQPDGTLYTVSVGDHPDYCIWQATRGSALEWLKLEADGWRIVPVRIVRKEE